MLKIRIIPVLTFNGLALVKTKQFANPRMVGNPVQAARVYNSRGVDELIFVDIFASRQQRKLNLPFVKQVLKECMIPLGVGGGIRDLDDVSAVMKAGADKVVLKTIAMEQPGFISAVARKYGEQAITIAVDAKRQEDGSYAVFHHSLPPKPIETFIREVEAAGAGELFVNSVDHDGMMGGFDIELYQQVSELSNLPLIACGGAGEPAHFATLFEGVRIEAAASASIYHFTQYTPDDIKRELYHRGFPVRLLSTVKKYD